MFIIRFDAAVLAGDALLLSKAVGAAVIKGEAVVTGGSVEGAVVSLGF